MNLKKDIGELEEALRPKIRAESEHWSAKKGEEPMTPNSQRKRDVKRATKLECNLVTYSRYAESLITEITDDGKLRLKKY